MVAVQLSEETQQDLSVGGEEGGQEIQHGPQKNLGRKKLRDTISAKKRGSTVALCVRVGGGTVRGLKKN